MRIVFGEVSCEMKKNNNKLLQTLFVVGLLLAFLSGKFSLSRLNLAGFQVRYALFAASLLLLLAFLGHNPKIIKFSQDSKMFLLLLLASTLYLMISMFWLEHITVGLSKFVDIVFLLFICLTLLVTIHTFENRDRLAVIVAYFFILIGFVYLFQIFRTSLTAESFRRGIVYAGGYNIQTRILFMSVCSSIFLFALSGRWRHLVLICLFLTGIILLMSKQGIIAAALVLMVFLLLKILNYFKNCICKKGKILKRASIGGILKIVTVVSVSILFLHNRLNFVFRYTTKYFRKFFLWRIFTGENLATVAEMGDRAQLFANSIKTIRQQPLCGVGLAGYLDVPGIGFYPHNIVLEFLLDGGILGGVFILMFMSYSIYIILKARKSIYLPFCLIPLYILIVSLASGGLYDFRYYFMWVIISLYLISNRCQSRRVSGQLSRSSTYRRVREV